MTTAIVIEEYGEPSVLKEKKVELKAPGHNEIRIKQTAVGVNFHDIYVRSGLYKSLSLPGIPGIEGVGVITELGQGVTDLDARSRVAYITPNYGGYASERIIPASIAIPLPHEISDEIAAATILKGLTVQMLTKKVTSLEANDWILIHAAAGGVGQLLTQEAKRIGAKIIGTVGSNEKSEIAAKNGCDEVILYKQENVLNKVMKITDNQGVNVVYDSVGKDTFQDSLASLTYNGHLINFGQSSGPVEGFEIPMLAKKSSTLSRPMVFHYTSEREKLLEMSEKFFDSLIKGYVTPAQPLALPLSEADKAHELLASRKLAQPVILIP
ncbi:quinone oxidoreductase family protein [Ekhidna sp.]|uniref:quinone oxidoreductase family protein n=1 Tax=Ekhidna sp. TaxID=2608089 RepID=UPI003BA89308